MTLPQSWAVKNRLKKGDSLNVQETLRNSLEIVATAGAPEAVETTELDITDRSIDDINSFLLATYLNGYSLITLRGPNSGKVSVIRKHVNELVAAEIMEMTPNKVVVNVLWEPKSINLRSVISRIENITRSLFIETTILLSSEINSKTDIKEILEVGHEVQRQVLLARRTITHGLNNSVTAYKLNLSSLELYYISYIVYFFGKIGEYIVEIAKIIYESRNDKALELTLQMELKELLNSTLYHFEKVLESYNKQNRREKFKTNGWSEIEKTLSSVQQRSFRKRMPAVPEYIKMIVGKIKEMEIFIINMENSPR